MLKTCRSDAQELGKTSTATLSHGYAVASEGAASHVRTTVWKAAHQSGWVWIVGRFFP